MLPVRKDVSVVCWGLGGIPIVGSLLQAILAAANTSALAVPGLAAIARALVSLSVFNSATYIFRSRSNVVFGLFVMIGVAWGAMGVAMLVAEKRQWTYAATGFVTLFLVLFLLVYLPIYTAGVPAAELVLFTLIPVVAAGANWVAALSYPWAPEVDEQMREEMSAARGTIQDTQQRFETIYDREFSSTTRNRLQRVAPDAVEQAKAESEAFRDRCQELLDEMDSIAHGRGGLSDSERHQEMQRLTAKAEQLDAEAEFEAIRERAVDALVDSCYDSFEDLHIVSKYDGSYEARNLQEYRSLSLPSIGIESAELDTAHNSVPDRIAEAATEGADLVDLARAVDTVQSHVEELESRIEREESSFADTVDEAEARLDTVREMIDDVDGQVGTRLEQLLLEGRYESDPPPGPSVPAVREEIEAGKTALHECDFGRANDHATAAEGLATELITIVEFFDGVSSSIEGETGSIPLVDDVSPGLASAMRVPYESTYDVEYSVADGRIEFSYPDDDSEDAASTTAASSRRDAASTTVSSTTDADNSDEVLYLLRELKQEADTSSSTDTIEYQTDGLPDYVLADPVVDRLVEFVGGQPSVESIDVDADLDPGYISVQVTSDRTPQAVVSDTLDRFQETVNR